MTQTTKIIPQNKIPIKKEYTIATYGTLKKGYKNHWIVKSSKFITNDKILNTKLFLISDVPMILIDKKHKNKTDVEVYKVNKNTFDYINQLETEWQYTLIETKLKSGTKAYAWIYEKPWKLATYRTLAKKGYWTEIKEYPKNLKNKNL